MAFVFEGGKLLRLLFGGGGVVQATASAAVAARAAAEAASEAAAALAEAAAAEAVKSGLSPVEGGASGPALAVAAADAAAEAAEAAAEAAAAASSGAPTLTFGGLVWLFLLNGLCYWCYNQTSFVVLGRVSFVTHATLNVMRRTCIIVVTAWWFAHPVTGANALGIALALGGFALFLGIKANGNALPTLPLVAGMARSNSEGRFEE